MRARLHVQLGFPQEHVVLDGGNTMGGMACSESLVTLPQVSDEHQMDLTAPPPPPTFSSRSSIPQRAAPCTEESPGQAECLRQPGRGPELGPSFRREQPTTAL